MAEQGESSQVDVRVVSYVAAGIIAVLIALVGILALSFPGLISRPPPVAAEFPAPSVRTDERTQRLQLEKAQQERLSGQNGGIPIERAMEMIIARGVKAFDPVSEAPP